MDLFAGFTEYVRAVVGHWAALVTGSVITAVLAVLGTKYTLPALNRAAFAIFVAFVWFAMFQAWQDQRLELRIAGSIENIGGGLARLDSGREVPSLFLIVRLRNGGPPSTADNWKLHLTYRGRDVEGILDPIPEKLTIMGTDGGTTFTKEEALYEKAAANPIPQGGQMAGILAFTFANQLTGEQVIDAVRTSSETIRLTFDDIFGRTLVCRDVSKFDTRSPVIHPGIKGERLPPVRR